MSCIENYVVKYLIVSIFIVIAGCSGRDYESNLGIKGTVDWVNKGTKVVENNEGRLIHGVGSSVDMLDQSLQISTADTRARAEISRIISTLIDSTIRDYSSFKGKDIDLSVERSIKSSSKSLLSGVVIIAHWRDPKTRIIYSLAELDLKSLDKYIEYSKKMATDDKDELRKKLKDNISHLANEDVR